MKKFIIVLFCILAGLYAIFFAGVYIFGDLNKYNSQISDIVSESVGLNYKASTLRIKPTWKLELNLVAENLVVSYPDDKDIFSVDNISVKLPILPVVVGDIKLSEIKIKSPEIKLSINKKGELDIMNHLTPYLEKMQNTDGESTSALPKYFRISTNMPDIKIDNYNIKIFDETIGQTVYVKGNNLDIVKFDLAKGLKVISKGKMGTLTNDFADYDIAVETFLPELEAANEEKNNEAAYIDIFQNMIKYHFYTDVFADLKISKSKNDGININGDLNVKKLDLRTKNTVTNGSFVNLKFSKNLIDVKSDFYLTKEQKANLLSNIKYGRKNEVQIAVKSDRLDLYHFKEIAQALFGTLGIPSELDKIDVQGYIVPNFTLKSDMKTLQSSGHIYLKDGKISHSAYPAKITDITSDIDLSGNKVTIANTKALVNNQPVSVSGYVTQNADCSLEVMSKNLSIKSLFDIFADTNMKKSYKIASGNLDFDVKVNGKLDKLMPVADAKISNLSLTDKINHFTLTILDVPLKLDTDLKTYKGTLSINKANIRLSDLGISASSDSLKVSFDDKDINLAPAKINIQNSILTLNGAVKDYAKSMNYDFAVDGNILTSTVKSFIPKEYKSMVANKGSLPVKLNVTGDMQKTDIKGQVSANSQNYITPLNISQLAGKPSTLNLDIKLSGKDLIIDDISLTSSKTNYAAIKGKILSYGGKNPVFNNLKISTPNNFSFSIPDMPNSFVTLTSDLTLAGTMNSPKILGNVNVVQAVIPSYKLNAKNITANMTNSSIKVASGNVNIDNTDLKFDLTANNDFSKAFVINNMNVYSDKLDLGRIMQLLADMPQNSNAPGTSVPLKIVNGKGTIKSFKMDTILAQNCSADFSFVNNEFYLKNLKATAYAGTVAGDLSYNIQYLRFNAKIKGQNLNANSAVTTILGLKDQMNGNLNFNANITMSGSTQHQQMQTLKGTASFVILDGQMGSLGKFEHFLYAQNLLSQSFVKTTVGSIASKLAPKNTGKFTKMSGDIGFSNGWATIVDISSTGPNMSLFLSGKYNLLNNNAKIDIYGKISEEVANSLGVVGELSIEKITSNIPKFGMAISNILTGYNVATSTATMNKIPQLSTGATSGTKSFRVKIDGNIESTTSIKSFMWLMSEETASAKKKEFSETPIVKDIQNVIKTTIPQTTTTNTKTTTEETKNQLKQAGADMLQKQVNKILPDFLNNIGTGAVK